MHTSHVGPPERGVNTATPLQTTGHVPMHPQMHHPQAKRKAPSFLDPVNGDGGAGPSRVPGLQPAVTRHGPQRSGPPSRRHANAGNPDNKTCNCRNSKCLKLYCECFASGRYCNACNCMNCMNNKDHEVQRSKAIETILERNPNAFRPKIQFQQGEDGMITTQVTRHSKGCSCRKSNCLKKYCECFQAGIFCAQTCRCKDCRNYEGSDHLVAVMENMDAAAMRTAVPASLGPPEPKRARVTHRAVPHPVHPHAGLHYVPQKKDPARDAIKHSRDRKMHEVLASMLTTLHVEAYMAEQKQQKLSSDVASASPDREANQGEARASSARDWTAKEDGQLSDYYVKTEGVLLGEFGDFLGKLADRIDEQVYKSAM